MDAVLTLTNMAAILCPLSQQVTAWFSSHKTHKMPIARLIHRLRFLMQKFNGGRYLGSFGSHGSCAMSTNPNNVHRPKFSSLKQCPQSFTRGQHHVTK
jgi:hypothetical protein